MINNPFAGPAHIVALANALEHDRRPGAYVRPPVTGGEQVSVRLNESLLTHLELLGKAAGWTRVQVLTALIERGLFDLYDLLSNETGESIMQQLVDQLVPVMHDESELHRAAKKLAREVVGEDCTVTPGQRPERFWVESTRTAKGIPRMLVIIESHAADDFAKQGNRAVAIENLRLAFARLWAAASSRAGTEIHCRVTPETIMGTP